MACTELTYPSPMLSIISSSISPTFPLPHALLPLSPLFLQLSLPLSLLALTVQMCPLSHNHSSHTEKVSSSSCLLLWGCMGTQGSACVGFRVSSSFMFSRDHSRIAGRLGSAACLSHMLTVLKNTSLDRVF